MKRFLSFLSRFQPGSSSEAGAMDRAIAYRLQHRFEGKVEQMRVQGFQFYVQNRVVSIYGTVHHILDRDLLLTMVRDTPGVIATESHIQVIRLATPARQAAAVKPHPMPA